MADAIPVADPGLLAAQAKAGQAGVDAYNAAISTLQQQKQQAVQGAMQEAAMRGSPEGAAASQSSIISSPYDQRIASLTQGLGSYQADQSARTTRMNDYNQAVLAARSYIPQVTEQTVAPIRAQADFNVRNTEMQGQQNVAGINAETELTMAKMQAAFQAAQIAAKKKGGGGGGGSGGGRSLTGTDLQAMMSQGVLAHMQDATGDILQVVEGNQAKSRAAVEASLAKQKASAVNAPTRLATARQAVTQQTAQDRLQNVNQRDTLAQLPGAYGTGKPTMPTIFSDAPDARQQALRQYQAQLAAWNAQQQANQVAQQQAAQSADIQQRRMQGLQDEVSLAQGAQRNTGFWTNPGFLNAAIQRSVPAVASAGGQYQSALGSITTDELKWMQGSNPFAAALIANSPGALRSSADVNRIIGGSPDQYGQKDPYSLQVIQAAQEQTLQDLVGAGYKIKPEDYQNAVSNDIKPGESLSEYMTRTTGQLDAAGLAKAARTEQSDYVGNLRDQEYLNTHDPNTGLPLPKPAKATTPAEQRAEDNATRAENDRVSSDNLLAVGLATLPPSSFGTPSQVWTHILSKPTNGVPNSTGYLFSDAYQSMMTSPPMTARYGMTAAEFAGVLTQIKEANPAFNKLDNSDVALLRHYFQTIKTNN